MRLVVDLVLGHKASIRATPSPEGHTHDFDLYVDCKHGNIGDFVDWVGFDLHESYDEHRRVIRHQPFRVRETASRGFPVDIDVHFKNLGSPQQVKFKYDFFLQSEGPSIHCERSEKLIFDDSNVEFAKHLLDGGAIVVREADHMDSSTPYFTWIDTDTADVHTQYIGRKIPLPPHSHESVEDEFDTFGKMMAQKLRKINAVDPRDATTIQLKMEEIVHGEELKLIKDGGLPREDHPFMRI